jgi:hypothetical protein
MPLEELRFALEQLRKRPGFALRAVLRLAFRADQGSTLGPSERARVDAARPGAGFLPLTGILRAIP